MNKIVRITCDTCGVTRLKKVDGTYLDSSRQLSFSEIGKYELEEEIRHKAKEQKETKRKRFDLSEQSIIHSHIADQKKELRLCHLSLNYINGVPSEKVEPNKPLLTRYDLSRMMFTVWKYSSGEKDKDETLKSIKHWIGCD